jgi:hypothetical protein
MSAVTKMLASMERVQIPTVPTSKSLYLSLIFVFFSVSVHDEPQCVCLSSIIHTKNVKREPAC